MITTLIIIFLCLAFIFLFYRFSKADKERLYPGEIILAFGFRVLLGCGYGYIFLHYFGGDDTWMFQQESLAEYQKLVHQPAQFFRDLLPVSAFNGSHNFWQGVQFYIMDLEYWFMIKMLAVFNIFSRGNYYINVVFFNSIVFWGHYLLFRLLSPAFPGKRRRLVLIIFFFPPVIFWLSGIRADGLVLFFIAILLYQFNKWVTARKNIAVLYCFLALTGILIFRNMLVLLLLPALAGWFFPVVYGLTAVLFFCTAFFSPQKNLPEVVVQRQQEYFRLTGNTRYTLDSLQPTVSSFAKVLPQSALNTFLRPAVWEAKGLMQVFASLDILFFWFLLLYCLFKKDGRNYFDHPLTWLMLLFGVSLYLFIGYTVPFPGAIVRYKITGELFMLLVFAIQAK